MERKLVEYGIILLHKYKVESRQKQSLDGYSLFYSQIAGTFDWIEHLHFHNLFSYFFHSYNVMCLGNICRITFWKSTKHPIKQSLKISTCSFKNMRTCNLFMAYRKNGFQDPERTRDLMRIQDSMRTKDPRRIRDPRRTQDLTKTQDSRTQDLMRTQSSLMTQERRRNL